MNLIWRFYSDSDHRWRWQRLSVDKSVVDESRAGYKEYESCLANAREQGYVFFIPITGSHRSPYQKPAFLCRDLQEIGAQTGTCPGVLSMSGRRSKGLA
jgi:hypothetical protein